MPLEIRKIHMKTPEACNFTKKETLTQVFSCEMLWLMIKPKSQIHLGQYFMNIVKKLGIFAKKQTIVSTELT